MIVNYFFFYNRLLNWEQAEKWAPIIWREKLNELIGVNNWSAPQLRRRIKKKICNTTPSISNPEENPSDTP